MNDDFISKAMSFHSKYDKSDAASGYTLYHKDGKVYLPESDRKSFEARVRIYKICARRMKKKKGGDFSFFHDDDPRDYDTVADHLDLPGKYIKQFEDKNERINVDKLIQSINYDDELESPSHFDPEMSLYDVISEVGRWQFEFVNCLLEHGIYLSDLSRLLNDPYSPGESGDDVLVDEKQFGKEFFKSIDPAKVILGYVDDPIIFAENPRLYKDYLEPLKDRSIQELFDIAFNEVRGRGEADTYHGSVIIALRSYLNNFIVSLLNDYYKKKTGHGEKGYLYNYQKYASDNIFNEYDHVYIGSRFTMYSRTSYVISHTSKGVSEKRIRHEYCFANSDRERLKTAYNAAKNIFQCYKQDDTIAYIPQVFLALMGVPYPAFKIAKYFSFDRGTADDFVNLFEFIQRPEPRRFSFVETTTAPDVYINSLVKTPSEMKVFTHINDDMFIVGDDFFDDESYSFSFYVEDREKYKDLIEGKDAAFLIDQWMYTMSLDGGDTNFERETEEVSKVLSQIDSGVLPPFKEILDQLIDGLSMNFVDGIPDSYAESYTLALRYYICGYIVTRCSKKEETDADWKEPRNYTYHDPSLPIKDFVPSEHGIVFIKNDRLYYQKSSEVFLEPMYAQSATRILSGEITDPETIFTHLFGLPFSYMNERSNRYLYTDIDLKEIEGYSQLIENDPRLRLSEKKRELKEKEIFNVLSKNGNTFAGFGNSVKNLSYGDERGIYLSAILTDLPKDVKLMQSDKLFMCIDNLNYQYCLEHEKDIHGNFYTFDYPYDPKIGQYVLPGKTFIAYQDEEGNFYLDEDDIPALLKAINLVSDFMHSWFDFKENKLTRLNVIGMSPVFYPQLLKYTERVHKPAEKSLRQYFPFRKVPQKSTLSCRRPYCFSSYYTAPFLSTQLRKKCLEDNVLLVTPFTEQDVENPDFRAIARLDECSAIFGEELSDFASFYLIPDETVFSSYLKAYYAVCQQANSDNSMYLGGEVIQAVYFKDRKFVIKLLNAFARDDFDGFERCLSEMVKGIEFKGLPEASKGVHFDIAVSFGWFCSLVLTYYILYSKKRIDTGE